MRIAFFLGLPNPFPGAGWTRVGAFARHLRARGHRVDVLGIVSPTTTAKAGFRSWDGVRIVNLCPIVAVNNAPFALFNAAASAVAWIPLLFALRPDVAIVSVPNGPAAVGAYAASRIAGAKVVFDYRDEWEDYAIGRAGSRVSRRILEGLKHLMARIYASSDSVVAVTEACAESLRERGVASVKVVPNGADTTAFRPLDKATSRRQLGLRDDDFVLVYNGTLGEYYHLDVVVRAAAELRKDRRVHVKLLIVGAGPRSRVVQVENVAAGVGLRDHILYVGERNDARELAQVLSCADVGLIPYDDNPLWSNALPAKLFEYCACGIPVIATVRGDSLLSKVINARGLGATVPPLNAPELSRAMRDLMVDDDRRRRSGRNGRKMVETSFDRDEIAAQFWRDIAPILATR